MEYADVSDGELRLGGSFRSSLTKGPTGWFDFWEFIMSVWSTVLVNISSLNVLCLFVFCYFLFLRRIFDWHSIISDWSSLYCRWFCCSAISFEQAVSILCFVQRTFSFEIKTFYNHVVTSPPFSLPQPNSLFESVRKQRWQEESPS